MRSRRRRRWPPGGQHRRQGDWWSAVSLQDCARILSIPHTTVFAGASSAASAAVEFSLAHQSSASSGLNHAARGRRWQCDDGANGTRATVVFSRLGKQRFSGQLDKRQKARLTLHVAHGNRRVLCH